MKHFKCLEWLLSEFEIKTQNKHIAYFSQVLQIHRAFLIELGADSHNDNIETVHISQEAERSYDVSFAESS